MREQLNQIENMLTAMGVWHKSDYSMAKATSFRVGGNADLYCKTGKKEEIKSIISQCRSLKLPITVIGKGSNLIVRDKGIRGVVLAISGSPDDIKLTSETSFHAGAGVSMAGVANFALEHSLIGAEFIHGIPGSLGGGIYMNAGAYGWELKDVIKKIYHLDSDLNEGSYTPYEAFMTYRYSDYSVNGFIITGADFSLEKGEKSAIKELMSQLSAKRSSSQPLEFPSAGSTFKRPKGDFAARLIEVCELKGVSVGGAMVSRKHSGFVINMGNATCEDILSLCEIVRETVLKKTGFDLELEPLVIGEK